MQATGAAGSIQMPRRFPQEFGSLISPMSLVHSAADGDDGPFLMIRARWLEEGKINPPDIDLRKGHGVF